jgi:Phosphatidylinositol 3- and 4-kinase
MNAVYSVLLFLHSKSYSEPQIFRDTLYLLSNPLLKRKVLFKLGDDMRQDMFVLTLFREMDRILQVNGLDLAFTHYNICACSKNTGFYTVSAVMGKAWLKLWMRLVLRMAFRVKAGYTGFSVEAWWTLKSLTVL